MTANRKKAEQMIYDVMDTLDKTNKNSNYYKEKFADMNDDEFLKFISRNRPFKFQVSPFEIEPSMNDAAKALAIMDVPLLEKVNLGYMYRDKNGNPVQSEECLTVYLPVKRMKQSLTEKTHVGTDISQRDMKSGRLVSDSKGGQTTDREFEAAAVLSLDDTIEELSRPRADAMEAKNYMNNIINTQGFVSKKDIPIRKEDSLSNNLFNTYLIGCLIKSNLITDDDYFINTIQDKQRRVERET